MYDQMDLVLRGIKIIDIGYITTIYFFIAILVARTIDKTLGPYDKDHDKDKHTLRIAFELIGLIWLVGTTTYITRNIVELIPFPLDGVYGFEHKRVKELGSGAVFVFVVMFFSYHLRAKMEYFYSRIKAIT